MFIPESELIINPDGSIYHLQLKPGDLAERIITVGDPKRIDMIKPYMSKIELIHHNREFSTCTGMLNGERTSIISTGIGTDNIDIVINEADALFNIDFETRTPKPETTVLSFIRIGTSGAIREEINIHDVILSELAIGLDGLLHYYKDTSFREMKLEAAFKQKCPDLDISPYACYGDNSLLDQFEKLGHRGITLTAPGFYGPQSRQLNASKKVDFPSLLEEIEFQGLQITNFEMETAGIYGLSNILGHKAISLNLILANRITKQFSPDPASAVASFIQRAIKMM